MIWYMQYIVSGAQTWIISMYINLNIYDFSGVRTFKIGCKIALVGKPQSGWEGRAQQSEVTSPRSCNKIFKHLNRVYQDIESCWFPRCSNGGRSPTVSKYTGSPALQITPGPLMPIISKCPQSPFPAGLQMPPGPQVNPGFQVYSCPSDPPCLPVPALQVPPGPQLPLKASSNEQSEHTKFTKEFWDFASFPHISNIWIWGKKKLAWRSTRSRCGLRTRGLATLRSIPREHIEMPGKWTKTSEQVLLSLSMPLSLVVLGPQVY